MGYPTPPFTGGGSASGMPLSQAPVIKFLLARLGVGAAMLPTGGDDTAVLNAGLNAVTAPYIPAGSAFRYSTRYTNGVAENIAIDVATPHTAQVYDFGLSSLTLGWDGSTPTATTASLTNTLRIIDQTGCVFANVIFDTAPVTSVKGTVISRAADNSSFVFEPYAGQVMPGVGINGSIGAGLDKIEQFDPTTKAMEHWSVTLKGGPDPIAVVANGDGRYTLTPPQGLVAILNVFQTTPQLIFRAPGNNMVEPVEGTVAGAGGLLVGGVSIVNGVPLVFVPGQTEATDVDEDNPSLFVRVYQADGITPLDAGAASAYTSGGTLSFSRVPSWIQPGEILAFNVRKRQGNIAIFNRNSGCALDNWWIKSGQALSLAGQNNDNLSIRSLRIDCLQDRPTVSAGFSLLRDTGGYIDIDFATVRGLGDNFINSPATTWERYIAAGGYANNGDGTCTITMRTDTPGTAPDGWNAGAFKGIWPRKPLPGHRLELWGQAGLYESTLTVLSVVGPVVVLQGSLPTGFFPATDDNTGGWTLLPRDYVAAVRGKNWSFKDSATPAVLIQSDDWRVETLNVENNYGGAIRASMPGSARLGIGGFKDGFWFRDVYAKECCYKRHTRLGAAIVVRQTDRNGNIITGAHNDRPSIIENLQVDGGGLGVIGLMGRDMIVWQYQQRNTGRARAGLSDTYRMCKYDFYVLNGHLQVGRIIGEFPSFYEDTDGYFTVLSGSGLVNSGTIAANATTVTAAKKVRVGHESRITVQIGGVVQDPTSYTANGTTTLTFASAPFPTGGPVPYTVTHTGC